jgi:uncharacterized protein YjbI with pentapeptide repeats
MNVLNSMFSDISFLECKISGVDWTKASWDSLIIKPLRFEASFLNGSCFYGLCLEEFSFKECQIKDVDFREANLEKADFYYSDLKETLFINTNLTKANFAYAKNFDINIRTNTLKGALFSRYDALKLLESLDIKLVD